MLQETCLKAQYGNSGLILALNIFYHHTCPLFTNIHAYNKSQIEIHN